MPSLIKINNPFDLTTKSILPIQAGLCVKDVISEYGIKVNAQPTICFYNGEPLLRKDWALTRINDTDQLAFLSLPQGGGGGGGSNPTRVVLSIAIMAAAVYTGGLAGATWGKIAGAIVSGTVAVAGSMLVNALIPAPKTTRDAVSGHTKTFAQRNISENYLPLEIMYSFD